MASTLKRLSGSSRPIPKPIAYPSDYGLAGAVTSLIRDYGRVGAVNRLIEMAEWIEAGQQPIDKALRCRRVDPHKADDQPKAVWSGKDPFAA